jgi:hypothetical protein
MRKIDSENTTYWREESFQAYTNETVKDFYLIHSTVYLEYATSNLYILSNTFSYDGINENKVFLLHTSQFH